MGKWTQQEAQRGRKHSLPRRHNHFSAQLADVGCSMSIIMVVVVAAAAAAVVVLVDV